MARRISTVVALAALAALFLVAPAWADHTTDHTIAQMTAHYQDPGLEPQNRPFALLYLRTTEGMRDANNATEFSDPVFWDSEVIPFAWRQLAWDNAQRLLAAPTAKEREVIAKEIRRHARDKAREILRWYR
jgi:hypothetical protein